MNTGPMATALRNTAAKVRQVNVETSAENDLLRDAAELLRVLARLMDGAQVTKAFGAPGDWGYETELGRAVVALHQADGGADKHANPVWPPDASDRVHDLIGQLAAKELECQRLRDLADSEGTRAVEYLRRARKAESEISGTLQRPDGMPTSADARHLRRLLAARVAMPHAYYDDGEAQGQEHGIAIDFMREPVADIDAKLRALNVARMECSLQQCDTTGAAPGPHIKTASELRMDAAHDPSCVGAFARARP